MLGAVDDSIRRDGSNTGNGAAPGPESAADGQPGSSGRATISSRQTPPPSNRKSRVKLEAEEQALARLRSGRRTEAFTILMRAYGVPLTAFITRIVRSGEDAKDLNQQVFLEAFRGIDRYEGRASIWSWLCGIAYNRSIDCIKAKKRTISVDGFDVLESLGIRLEQTMSGEAILIRKALEKCLAKLRPEIRAQVLMRFGEQMSYQEIGEVLGEEHGTVQVRISRVLPKLRKCLRTEGMR